MADRGVAPSQDRVVELAIDEFARRIREADDEAAWARAASDPLFNAETARIDEEFSPADTETWPPS